MASILVALPADASTLLFTITNGGSLVESFKLDSDAGIADLYPGYVAFRTIGDTLGQSGVYFGDPSTGNAFGTGQIAVAGGIALVWPYYDDRADTLLYGGTGLSLAIGPGSSFATAAGYRVTVAAAAPEPATWAVALIGFGAIGATLRRGRRRAPQSIALFARA